jgi:hypothetical protein
MTESDHIVSRIAAGILRNGDRELEALKLEDLVDSAGDHSLDDMLREADRTDTRGGAFGLEVAAAIVVPIAIEAAKQLWSTYAKKLLDEVGTHAAKATLAQFKRWLSTPDAQAETAHSGALAAAIRKTGRERGLEPADIEALVGATAPDRLAKALVAD